MRELTIITNENIYSDNENFYCDNLDIKTLSEGLSNQFKVHLIGRSSKVHRSHKINIQNQNELYHNLVLKHFKNRLSVIPQYFEI